VTAIYKIGLEIWGSFPPKWRAKNIKISARLPKTSRLDREYIENASIISQKTALQTAITITQVNLIWRTLVHKRRKTGPEFWPTQNQNRQA